MDAYWFEGWSGFEFQHEAGVEAGQRGPACSQKILSHWYLLEGRGMRRRREEGGMKVRRRVEREKRRWRRTRLYMYHWFATLRAGSCISYSAVVHTCWFFSHSSKRASSLDTLWQCLEGEPSAWVCRRQVEMMSTRPTNGDLTTKLSQNNFVVSSKSAT